MNTHTHTFQRMKTDDGGYFEAIMTLTQPKQLITTCCTYHAPIQTAVVRSGHSPLM